MSDVYYKIYYMQNKDYVTVVCMQRFDEDDYNGEHFFKNKKGDILKFYKENDAIEWLLDNVREDKIDPEYKNGFNQKRFMK
jgi:hypothetical protein